MEVEEAESSCGLLPPDRYALGLVTRRKDHCAPCEKGGSLQATKFGSLTLICFYRLTDVSPDRWVCRDDRAHELCCQPLRFSGLVPACSLNNTLREPYLQPLESGIPIMPGAPQGSWVQDLAAETITSAGSVAPVQTTPRRYAKRKSSQSWPGFKPSAVELATT